MKTETGPTLADIQGAQERLRGVAQVTPMHYSETFSRRVGRRVLLKAENLQRTGSFKIRGAYNRIATLSEDERAAGVVAASAGNHGQAVAWAAREVGVEATVFMPQDAPMAKMDATKHYGARVELIGEAFDECLSAAQDRVGASGATFIHPFEDTLIMAGQGTIGLELAEQVPDAETVVIPIGGGGLAAGISLALRAVKPDIRLVGVQAGKSGYTIADGIHVKHPGELTTAILDETLDDRVDVTDDEISDAIVLLVERAKLVVEGAGAASLAALLAGRVGGGSGTVVPILSGGNIDPTVLIAVMRHGLTLGGRYLAIRTRVPDRPGELNKLLTLIAEQRVSVQSVEHHREGVAIGVAETEIELILLTRDEDHCREVLAELERRGYPVERLR